MPKTQQKVALITGITGQDGSFLADLLLAKGYTVYGMERRTSVKHRANIAHIEDQIHLVTADLSDQHSLSRIIGQIRPHEIYNLAAQSFVQESWYQPEYTSDATGLGALRVLESIREIDPKIRFYQASSSEMFGKVQEIPQRESTPFYPRSPYGVSKLYAHWMAINYRESYGIFAANGILFNHESERRGIEFVTRKISDAVARIKHGLQGKLVLGNLDSKRDWGYAPEYVEVMWRMLQEDIPDDYVVATGEMHTIREFVEEAFAHVGLDWKQFVVTDSRFMRPAEVDVLVGDPTKAKEKLGWEPTTKFRALVHLMVDADMARVGAL